MPADAPRAQEEMESSASKYIARAYSLSNDPTAAETLYDEWADQYDADLTGVEYAFPTQAATALLSALGRPSTSDSASSPPAPPPPLILDAGCGTGLAGAALASHAKSTGFPTALTLHGIDISQGMLDVARRTGLYSRLERVDMTRVLEQSAFESGAYDAVMCVGTFTTGHVGARPALWELVRVARPGGPIVFSVLPDLWDGEFRAVVSGLVRDGRVVDLETVQTVRIAGGDDHREGLIVVLRKLGPRSQR